MPCGRACGVRRVGRETLHVVSKAVPIETVDLGPNDKSKGDVYVFDGPLVDEDEQSEIGHVYGTQTSIAIEGDAEVVQAMITYTFDPGDSITIGGVSRYPMGDVGLIKNRNFDRPILGGTGKYAGARGTVTSVRRTNGDFLQTFHLEG
jgi:Dirigent-like protein